MTEVFILVLKVLIVGSLAILTGYKTGLFNLNRVPSVVCFCLLLTLFIILGYSSNLSFVATFSSSFLSFTWDLAFFLKIFLMTILLGMLCSVFGIEPAVSIKNVKDLCSLAVLIAITAVLAIYATIRIGGGIKISFKFISVFVTAAVFGPFWGGMVGALADILAFLVNPVGGMFLPQITFVEFLYGFTYGLAFYNLNQWNGYKSLIKIVTCVVLQILVLNLYLTTKMLVPLMRTPFNVLVVQRAIPGVINMAIQLVVISVMTKYLPSFRRALK